MISVHRNNPILKHYRYIYGLIHKALDLGINFLDTADMYGVGGSNEILVGKALKGRESLFSWTF
jgi:aryl-alcohol dehydrogenase-like predicted oxidoreductase